MRSLSELWKLSQYFYKELAFLSMLDMRKPNSSEEAIRKVLSNSTVSMQINKIFLSLVFIAAEMFAVMQHTVISYTSVFILITFMFALFFLQSVTYFFKVNFDILATLPISKKEQNIVKSFTFLRIFDTPLVITAISFPLLAGFVSLWSIAPAFIGAVLSEIFAIAIVLYLSKIFYKKLASPSRGWNAALRFVFIIIWGSAFFVLYAVMIWLPIIYRKIEHFEPVVEHYELLLRALFPFDIAYMMLSPEPISIISSLLFLALGIWLAKRIIREIGTKINIEYKSATKIELHSTTPLVGMLKKDLKITTRSPGLAMLLILPALEGLLLMGMNMHGTTILSVIITFVIIYLYSLFGFENMPLLRSLPVSKKFLFLEKTAMAYIVFLGTLAIMNLYGAITGHIINPVWQALLGISMAAASIVVLALGDMLGIRTNVAMSALGFLLLVIIGNAIALAPIITCIVVQGALGIILSFSTAAGELLLTILYLHRAYL